MTSPATSSHELIRFTCWACDTGLSVPAHLAGVSGPCPHCGQVLAAPAKVSISPPPEGSPKVGSGGYRLPSPKPPAEVPAKPPGLELPFGGVIGLHLGKVTQRITARIAPGVRDPRARKLIAWSVYGCCLMLCLIVVCVISSHLSITD